MLHHIGVYVTNLEKSLQVYETILPVEKKEIVNWNNFDLMFLTGAGFRLELIPETMPDSRTTHIAFSVDHMENKITELQQSGISPSEGPFNLENGWKTVFYEGPDGEEIEFIQTSN
ncbi:VOC family protein [Fictibacillus phosphorivorans]|uniref:VOC family protein n=1 Tax=Fictibacillus phosphorivorans TaxID=1221500 RepID=UPI00203CF200|nr:VOC family protein [Fictibacillus phosphorivorans]MCM3719409.1 VOC family protein [Fictibacillus phosphorivorans]MCM3777113.1 VOC family protein [Fictibacillus phosphorivorans]